jgi:hypothetical protein
MPIILRQVTMNTTAKNQIRLKSKFRKETKEKNKIYHRNTLFFQ